MRNIDSLVWSIMEIILIFKRLQIFIELSKLFKVSHFVIKLHLVMNYYYSNSCSGSTNINK